MPYISFGSRSRPNRCSLASDSQARNRGQARVHEVQPFTPWVQSVRPELLLEVERPVVTDLVVVADDVVGAGDDAAGAARAQAAS